jgi:D-aspartate ligase
MALPHAVVIGLDCITGLQTARILAGRGVPVVGVAGNPRHFAARTQVCERILAGDLMSVQLIDLLVDLGPTLPRRAVLVPCTDLSVLLVSRYRDRLSPWYHVLLPDHATVETLTDKVRFIQHAQENGLPIPHTVVLRNRTDAEYAAKELKYPCVLKPPVKSATWQRFTSLKVIQVENAHELLATYDRVSGWADVLLAQQWVEGGEDALYSCNAYFDATGQPLATFVARKVRQWPPHTGTSTLGEECRNDEVLIETLKLFQGVGFHGLAYLEMKRDARSGRHYIIEPNVGRPTGRSAIAERGGVELLYTAFCDAVDIPLLQEREQRYVGVKWIDLRRDLQSAAYFMRRGELTPRQWLASVRGRKAHAVLSWTDPRPFLFEMAYAGGQAVDAAKRWGRRTLRSGERLR